MKRNKCEPVVRRVQRLWINPKKTQHFQLDGFGEAVRLPDKEANTGTRFYPGIILPRHYLGKTVTVEAVAKEPLRDLYESLPRSRSVFCKETGKAFVLNDKMGLCFCPEHGYECKPMVKDGEEKDKKLEESTDE